MTPYLIMFFVELCTKKVISMICLSKHCCACSMKSKKDNAGDNDVDDDHDAGDDHQCSVNYTGKISKSMDADGAL